MVPQDLRYTKEHEWVRIEGDMATVGITDYAAEQLGDVVFVELPELGRSVTQFAPIGVIESVKAVSDLFAPLNGEIVEANKAVVKDPALVNKEPHAGGWFFKIKLSNPAELNALHSPEDYKKQIGG